MAYLCNRTANRRPRFIIKRKCAGIPIAAKITVTVRPIVVRGTGAPKPTIKVNKSELKISGGKRNLFAYV